MRKIILSLFVLVTSSTAFAQNQSYWQQHVDYTMDVTMDVKTHQYTGTQQLVYTNNSPDALTRAKWMRDYKVLQTQMEE
mgnify:CR=1 FL=1